ncbi:MAG TPA: rhomboid family intramembrane serine protease [Acidisarcina sp.]|nr:rhomboid family intramembrane serine protease [Acidisarcina sp.]
MDSQRPNGFSRPIEVQPEILPPGYEPDARFREPMRDEPVEHTSQRGKSRWAYAPATYVLVAINCLVFLVMVLNGVSPQLPTTTQLLTWGANNGSLVMLHGEWWRLLSAAFVHVGLIHLATNMWCLWNLGLLGEPLLGPIGLTAVYVLSGISGNLLSDAVHPGIPGHPGVIGAGASGAVFGLCGVLIMLLKSPLLPVPPLEVKRLRQSVINFAILNFVIGGSTWFFHASLQIDNMAHLGGFLCGLALGVPLVPRIGAPRQQFRKRQRLAYYGMAILLMVLGFGIFSFWLSA